MDKQLKREREREGERESEREKERELERQRARESEPCESCKAQAFYSLAAGVCSSRDKMKWNRDNVIVLS